MSRRPGSRDGAVDPSPAPPRRAGHWRDRWLALRDRLLASAAFRRRAAAFVPTRPLARRRARELFDLTAGFVYSQVLLACVRLHLFERLAEGPTALEALAAKLALPPEAARRLLEAAVALRLVERRSGGRYGLGALGAPMVGNAAVASMVEHHAVLYADLADPVALLRASGAGRGDAALSRYWAYDDALRPAGADAGAQRRVAAYSALMAASQPLVAGQVLDAYPLHRHRCLLDVGGGDGRFLSTAAARAPHLQLMLFDLPALVDAARRRLADAGLEGRARVFGGSFLDDGALPAGADVVSLLRVVHDHDDAAARRLLRAVHDALPPGGTLLLAEPMAGTPGAEAMGDAYFGWYLLAMGRGRPRRREELVALLREAGFDRVDERPTPLPLQARLLVARRGR